MTLTIVVENLCASQRRAGREKKKRNKITSALLKIASARKETPWQQWELDPTEMAIKTMTKIKKLRCLGRAS